MSGSRRCWWTWRMLGGVAIGPASNLSPMYIAEIAPPRMRGRLVSINQHTIVIGILLAQALNWWLVRDLPHGATDEFMRNSWFGQAGWRWMFGLTAAPAAQVKGLPTLLLVLAAIACYSDRTRAAGRRMMRAADAGIRCRILPSVRDATYNLHRVPCGITMPGARPTRLLIAGALAGTLGLVLAAQSRVAAQGLPAVSIGDASVAEGGAGLKTVAITVRLSAPSSSPATVRWATTGAPGNEILLPPVNAAFDYQLGGAYAPPAGVAVLTRDRSDAPAAGLYNICYVNGFQVQPGEEGLWEADLILRDANGDPVIDPDWDEMLLDVGTADKRSRIAAVVGGWIRQCGSAGFAAVEIDNLDSYSRSGGRLSQDHAVAYMALLSRAAHDAGLAIAQKNSTEILDRRAEMGTDFAVAEECSRYSECGDYVGVYGERVLMIEYRDSDFAAGCSAYGATHAIVRRDLNLVTPDNPAYVYGGC